MNCCVRFCTMLPVFIFYLLRRRMPTKLNCYQLYILICLLWKWSLPPLIFVLIFFSLFKFYVLILVYIVIFVAFGSGKQISVFDILKFYSLLISVAGSKSICMLLLQFFQNEFEIRENSAHMHMWICICSYTCNWIMSVYIHNYTCSWITSLWASSVEGQEKVKDNLLETIFI